MPPQYPVRACNIKAKTIWISSSSDSEEEAGLGVGRISSPKSTSKEKLPTLLSSNPPPVLLREAQAHISPISAKEAISTSSQEDSPVETSHNKIDIDPAGDMYLMIEDKDSKPDTPESTKTRTSFRVNSHIISLASRVLAARISFSASPSRSQSQTPKQPLYIELTDDNTDPEALSFILNLLHHRHVEINVPTDLAESLEKLYSIARISSKFKLNGCETLKLWAQKWVSSIGGGNVEKKLLELAKWERALDVAYVFGLGGLREKASNKVIYFSEMEEGGELVVKGRKVGTLLPDAVKDILIKTRLLHLRLICSRLEQHIHKFKPPPFTLEPDLSLAPNNCPPSQPGTSQTGCSHRGKNQLPDPTDITSCNALTFTGLDQAFLQVGLRPRSIVDRISIASIPLRLDRAAALMSPTYLWRGWRKCCKTPTVPFPQWKRMAGSDMLCHSCGKDYLNKMVVHESCAGLKPDGKLRREIRKMVRMVDGLNRQVRWAFEEEEVKRGNVRNESGA